MKARAFSSLAPCVCFALLASAIPLAVACSADSAATDGGARDASTDAPAEAASPIGPMVVTPNPASVLTCGSIKFTARPHAVSWAVAPSGTIDLTGFYEAGATVPPGGAANVTARSPSGETVGIPVSVAVAKPGNMTTVASSTRAAVVYEQSVAANGRQMYAVSQQGTALVLTQSEDGGASWSAPSPISVPTKATTGCAAIAVDPVDPATLYLVYAPELGSSLSLAISNDRGATFKDYPLTTSDLGGDTAQICPTITAHSAGQVLVVSGFSLATGGPSNSSIAAWFDGKNGADIGPLVVDPAAVHRKLAPATQVSIDAFGGTDIASNGGIRSPRVASSGQGFSCATYHAAGGPVAARVWGVYVQCTKTGKQWTSPVLVAAVPSAENAAPGITIGDDGAIFVTFDSGGKPMFSQSRDGGQSFAVPSALPTMPFDGVAAPMTPRLVSIGNVLWMTYADVGSNATARTVVGKSCDGGRNWGSVMPVNVADATVDPVLRPFLLRSETQAILAGQRPDGVKDALAFVTKTLE